MSIELLLGLWGAIVSTILGAIKILESRKKIFIKFTYITFCEAQEMVITNIGKRSVTIDEVGVRIIRTKQELQTGDPYFASPIFPDKEDNERGKLPLKLSEGESIRFLFSVAREDCYEKGRILAYAKDTSGTQYSTKTVYLYNAKFRCDSGKVTKRDSMKNWGRY